MSEARVSILELRFLDETLELVEEEFDGVMMDASDYVLTTGAQEMVEEARELISKFLSNLEPTGVTDESID